MELLFVFASVINLFAPAPDLCADVHLGPTGAPYADSTGQTLSRYCEWTGPDAPVWDDDLCCTVNRAGARCTATSTTGRCQVGLKMYCEFGEVLASGQVACYQPFPDACEAGQCVRAPAVGPRGQETFLGCCSAGGVCQGVDVSLADGCMGVLFLCDHGFANEDGTVECYDGPLL